MRDNEMDEETSPASRSVKKKSLILLCRWDRWNNSKDDVFHAEWRVSFGDDVHQCDSE